MSSHKMPSDKASRSKTRSGEELLQMEAQAEEFRATARKLDNSAKEIRQNLSAEDIQRASEIVGVKANLDHKNAAYKWLRKSSKRTQAEARELLEKGTLPGLERVKVLISQSSFSKFCGKMDSGLTTKEGKRRPQIFSEETCQFITRLIAMG